MNKMKKKKWKLKHRNSFKEKLKNKKNSNNAK